MNKVELLPKNIKVGDTDYDIRIYVTSWNRLCIAYQNPVNISDKIISVVIEPENLPVNPTFDWIGNARNLDDACDMISEYLYKNTKITVEN